MRVDCRKCTQNVGLSYTDKHALSFHIETLHACYIMINHWPIATMGPLEPVHWQAGWWLCCGCCNALEIFAYAACATAEVWPSGLAQPWCSSVHWLPSQSHKPQHARTQWTNHMATMQALRIHWDRGDVCVFWVFLPKANQTNTKKGSQIKNKYKLKTDIFVLLSLLPTFLRCTKICPKVMKKVTWPIGKSHPSTRVHGAA